MIIIYWVFVGIRIFSDLYNIHHIAIIFLAIFIRNMDLQRNGFTKFERLYYWIFSEQGIDDRLIIFLGELEQIWPTIQF